MCDKHVTHNSCCPRQHKNSYQFVKDLFLFVEKTKLKNIWEEYIVFLLWERGFPGPLP